MTPVETAPSPAAGRTSPLSPPLRLHALSDEDPAVRERAWEQFYPRARAIASAKLRGHFGLRAGLDDQDVEDVVDAAIGILYRRCRLAPPDNPVRQPYALLVSISVHLLPKQWKQRRRERAAVERIARNRPELSTPAAGDCHEPDPNAQARSFAHWLLLQLDKALPTMPKEIRAGMLGTLFLDAGRTEALEETLAAFPKARRRICMLYHIEGVAASQIALQSDCGPSNISNSLRRCWMAFNSSAAFRRALEEIADESHAVTPV